MNKKAMNKARRTAADKLSFKRETVRSLSAADVQKAVGGRTCIDSCRGATCPNSVCTFSLDETI